jgi:hypothetical protein
MTASPMRVLDEAGAKNGSMWTSLYIVSENVARSILVLPNRKPEKKFPLLSLVWNKKGKVLLTKEV